LKRRAKVIFAVSLLLTDVAMVVLAFFLAYELRLRIPWRMPAKNIGPFRNYAGMMAIHALSVLLLPPISPPTSALFDLGGFVHFRCCIGGHYHFDCPDLVLLQG